MVGQAARSKDWVARSGSTTQGMAITRPSDVDNISAHSAKARNFVEDAVGSSSSEITMRYGNHVVPPMLAVASGKAHTQEEVVNTLKDMAYSRELSSTTGRMPTLSNYRKARSAGADTGLSSKFTAPIATSYLEEGMRFANHEFIKGDPYAVEPIMAFGRSIGIPADVVKYYGAMLYETPDSRRWNILLANLAKVGFQQEVEKALGEERVHRGHVAEHHRAVRASLRRRGAGFEGQYGSDFRGWTSRRS